MTMNKPSSSQQRATPAVRLGTMELSPEDVSSSPTLKMPTFAELTTLPTLLMEIARPADTASSMSLAAFDAASGLRLVRKSIFSALFKLISFSLMVRFISLIAQVVISYYFGAGAIMDGYFAAQTLPAVLASLLVSGLEVSVVPTFIHAYAQGQAQPKLASKLFSTIFNVVLLLTGLVTAVLILADPFIIRLIAPKLNAASYQVAVAIAPIIFPTLLLNVLAGYLRSILNTKDNFGLSALAEGAIPLATIAATIYCITQGGNIMVLSIGLLAGTTVQVGWLLAQMHRTQVRWRPTINWRLPELRQMVSLGAPVLLSSMLILANPLVDQIVASTLNAGTISAMNYALRLIGVVSTLLFVTMSRAVFPFFSRQAAENDITGLKRTLRYYLWLSGVVMTLVAIGFYLTAPVLVRIIYQHGQFTSHETATTVAILRGFIIGLPAMGIGFIVPRAFSALKRNDMLLWITLIGLVVNAALDVVLARQFGPPGIALSTAGVYIVAVVLEIFFLQRMIGSLHLLDVPGILATRVWGKDAAGGAPSVVSARVARWLAPLRHRAVQVALAVGVFLTLGIEQAHNAGRTVRLTLGTVLVPLLLRYPAVMVFGWALLLPFNTLTVDGHELGGSLSTLSLPTFLIALIVYRGEFFRRHPGALPLVAFIGWIGLGAVFSSVARTGFLADAPAYLTFLGIMLFTTLLRTKRQVYALMDLLLTVGTLVAAFAILQNRYHFGVYYDGGKYRAQGIFDWSNTLGYYLNFMLPLAIFRAYFSGSRWRLMWSAAIALIAGGIYVTYSRESEIAAVVSVLAMLFVMGQRPRIVAVALGGLGSLVLALGPLIGINIIGRFNDANASSLDGRFNFWPVLLHHFAPLHLFGAGLGSADRLVEVATNGYLTTPHNIYLELLYDTGIIGVTLFALILLVPLAQLLRHRADGPEGRGMRALGVALIVSSLTFSITESLLNSLFSVFFYLLFSIPFSRAFAMAPLARHPETVTKRQLVLTTVGTPTPPAVGA